MRRKRKTASSRFPISSMIIPVCLFTFFSYLNNITNISSPPILIDLAIIFIIFFISLFLFSQFIIPINSLEERWMIFYQLLLFLIGKHGEISKIRNGKINRAKLRSKKNCGGIIHLDATSAAVLKSPTRYTRTVGPGFIFTNKDEKIAGAVDLCPQEMSLGPLFGENPFTPKKRNESSESYEARMRRRNETISLTRDGIEIIPSITINYRIDTNPNQGNNFFGFNANSVKKAVISQSAEYDETSKDNTVKTDWHFLPGRLAITLWKEHVSKFMFNELFPSKINSINKISLIENSINAHLSSSMYKEPNPLNNLPPKTEASKEYRLLFKHGLRLVDIKINQLWLPPEIETQAVSSFYSTWKNHEEKKIFLQEEKKKLIEGTGKLLALKKLVENFNLDSNKYLLSNKKEIAIWLLERIKCLETSEPQIAIILTDEIKSLRKLYYRFEGF